MQGDNARLGKLLLKLEERDVFAEGEGSHGEPKLANIVQAFGKMNLANFAKSCVIMRNHIKHPIGILVRIARH